SGSRSTSLSSFECIEETEEIECNSTSSLIAFNGGSSSPTGFDVEDGKIVRIGNKVRVWLSTTDSNVPVCADPSNQVKYYTQGNTSGSTTYSDIYVVHKNSGYMQDGNWRS